MQLIAVVLGAETSNDIFAATKSLLDYGFANYTVLTPEKLYVENLAVDGGEKTNVPADYKPISLLVKKGSKSKVEQKAFFEEEISAPIIRGQVLGRVIYSIDGVKVGESPIVASEDVRKVDFGIMFNKIWDSILKGIF
jgi:D-alanyl-D-alanine carboxypeptidase (penicillin-binding protein 5/6)